MRKGKNFPVGIKPSEKLILSFRVIVNENLTNNNVFFLVVTVWQPKNAAKARKIIVYVEILKNCCFLFF
jgi:hypothetical protein